MSPIFVFKNLMHLPKRIFYKNLVTSTALEVNLLSQILKIGKTHKSQKGHVNFSNIKVIQSFKLGQFPSFPCTNFRDSLSSLLSVLFSEHKQFLWQFLQSVNFTIELKKKRTKYIFFIQLRMSQEPILGYEFLVLLFFMNN